MGYIHAHVCCSCSLTFTVFDAVGARGGGSRKSLE